MTERVTKLREWYRVAGADLQAGTPPEEVRAEMAIVELSDLSRALAREMTADVRISYPVTLKANDFLALIANKVRHEKGEEPIDKESEIENWFSEFPISVEQTVELLIATISALTFRRRPKEIRFGLKEWAKRAQLKKEEGLEPVKEEP